MKMHLSISYKKVTTAQKGAYFFCAKILAMITMQQVRAIKNYCLGGKRNGIIKHFWMEQGE